MGIRKPFKLKGKPSWYIDINRKRRSLHTTDHREAMQLYRDICRKQELTGEVEQKKSETVSDFVEDFLRWSQGTQAENTFRAYRTALRLFEKGIGVISLASIDQKRFDLFASSLLKQELSRSSVNAYLRKIRAAFTKAREWYGVPIVKVRLVKESTRPPAIIPREKFQEFFANLPLHLRLLAEGYLASGRRRGELLDLKWEDIDFENRRYYVSQQKIHNDGWFPLGSAFQSLLSRMPQGTGRIFARITGNYLTARIKQALRRSGLDRFRLHDLRHTYASMYLEAGGRIEALQELLGHRNIRTTMIYKHLTPAHLLQEADRVTLE